MISMTLSASSMIQSGHPGASGAVRYRSCAGGSRDRHPGKGLWAGEEGRKGHWTHWGIAGRGHDQGDLCTWNHERPHENAIDPYEHGHIWRIISHSQTSPTHFVANASHMMSHNLSHMISNIISQTTSQLYPVHCVFSDHIFRRARMLFVILLFIYTRLYSQCLRSFRGTILQVTQIFGWYI